MALGSIENEQSQMVLSKLTQDLPKGEKRNLALKQLRSQYKLHEINLNQQSL